MDILQHISWGDPHDNRAPSSSSEAAHPSARKLYSPLEPIHGCHTGWTCLIYDLLSKSIQSLQILRQPEAFLPMRTSMHVQACMHMCARTCQCQRTILSVLFWGPSSCLFLIQSCFALWFTSWASLAQGILLPLPRHGWNSKCLLPHLAFSCGFCRLNSGLCACRVSTLPIEPSLAPRERSVQTNYRITGTIHMEEYPCQLCLLQRYEGS